MNSNERRLKMIYLLQSGRKNSASSIAESFNISKRTVYRDLNVIQKMGVPITHYPDEGYGILRGGQIPPIMFTFKELAVILMGLSFVSSQVDLDMALDAHSVLLKIQNAIPEKLRREVDLLEKKTLVSPYIRNIIDRQKGGDWFIICMAFTEKKPVSFLYKDRKDVLSKRTMDPQLLIHFTDHWNVIGFCHQKKALRSFVLSRMSEVQTSTEPLASANKSFSIDEMLYGRQVEETPITVQISGESVFHFLTELPGRILSRSKTHSGLKVTFGFDNLDYINEWLLRFGSSVTIIEPLELIFKRKQLLISMSQK